MEKSFQLNDPSILLFQQSSDRWLECNPWSSKLRITYSL